MSNIQIPSGGRPAAMSQSEYEQLLKAQRNAAEKDQDTNTRMWCVAQRNAHAQDAEDLIGQAEILYKYVRDGISPHKE